MRDTWVELGRHPLARELFKKVGLKTPPQLLRAYKPWSDELLRGKRILMNKGGFFEVPLKQGLESHRAQVDRPNPESGEAGLPLAPVAAYQGSLFDATGLETVESLHQMFSFFQTQLRKMGFNHRIVIIVADVARSASPTRRAVSRAAEGFMRSLAKELGPKGVQVNAVKVRPERAQDEVLRALVTYLLSDFCSFVTGQLFTLHAAAASPMPALAGSLAGKRALVTGAAQGIGYAISRRLAEEGAHVLCLDLPQNEAPLAELARSIDGEVLTIDLASADSAALLAEKLQSGGMPLDILVHNAGITRDRSLFAMQARQWDSVLQVNLEAPLRVSLELLHRGLIAPFGRIIAMSSIVGLAGNYGQSNYSAAKAGLIGMVESLAEQVASQGICVNAVAPGFIETPMTAHLPFMAKQFARRLSSLQQGGLPDDVAEMVCFLASPYAQGLNGSVIRVCGGNFLGA